MTAPKPMIRTSACGRSLVTDLPRWAGDVDYMRVGLIQPLIDAEVAKALQEPRATPAPDAAAIREAALREAAAVVRKCGEEFLGQGGKSQAKALALVYLDILALLTEKPHD